MKSLSLVKQLIIGFLLSLFASICIGSLSLIFNLNDAFYLGFLATTVLYIALILKNSQIKTGRVVVFISSVVAAALAILFIGPGEFLLAISLLSIFLVRAVYHHTGLVSTAFDAALICFGFFIASGVLVSTQSWFLSFWCFFFIQSFLVYAPELLEGNRKAKFDSVEAGDYSSNRKSIIARNIANEAIQQLTGHSH